MSSCAGNIRVLFSVTNCICFDQRVLKMAGVLSGMGLDVTIAGRRRGDCCNGSEIPYKTLRFRMLFRRGFLFYKFFNIRLLFFMLFRKFDLLVANDLDTLPASFLAALIKKIPLVYDSHEYFTGLPELNNRRLVKSVWKCIEKIIFPRLKYVLTVSESISRLYEKEYGKRAFVVRNLAPATGSVKPISRRELSIPEGNFVLMIQGTGINIDKGCEEAVEAVACADNLSLIIAGSGDIIPSVRKIAGRQIITGKVKLFQSMPWQELMRYTKAADAGLVLEKDTNLNYRYSLPNKLFDYISAGIPVITSNLPEITAIVTRYNCGIIIPEVTPVELYEAVEIMRQNSALREELQQNAVKASRELNWENEAEKARAYYRDLFCNENILLPELV